MWVVRLELASVRLVEVNKKRKNKVDLFSRCFDFFFFYFFVRTKPWNQTGNEKEKGAPALLDFFVFSFLTCFSV